MLLKTLDRYIFREVLVSWTAVTGVLLVILVTFQLTAVLQRAADARFPREVVLTLIGFSSLEQLTILAPVGLLLGIVLAFGRLYHESEMAAIHACGVGLRRLYGPVMLLTGAIVAVLAWLAMDLSPRAAERVQSLRAVAMRDAEFVGLEAGRFLNLGGENGGVLYAASMAADGTLEQVFVKRHRSNQMDNRMEVTTAARARHIVSEDGRVHTFVLEDGRLYEGFPGSREFRITEFKEQGIPVRLPEASLDKSKLEMKPTAELIASTERADTAELQWRLSMPVMALVLGFLAVPLSRLKPRQGRYARIGYAILTFFAYFNLLSAAKVWVERGVLPPEVGVWWVHAVFVVVGLLLLRKK